jgi:M6 family metalloprotease-like protein
MNDYKSHFFSDHQKPLIALLVFLLVWGLPHSSLAGQVDDTNEVHRLRASRRSASRVVQNEKAGTGSPATFGLLVIPVDFSDARLPDSWQSDNLLSNQLFGSTGHTMENYFGVASQEKLDLKITLAPLVSLDGKRIDYYDRPLTGFSRSRALATEALGEVARMGLEFRRLDMDGPDGIPGSPDDDGQVDGVLILHSGPGQENDSDDGWIAPLQFFLEEPVVSGGVQASFYAVASLHSGLGIWAHETAHLLGMEDRYDPLLQPSNPGADIRSYGGLGRFSLMASGAWGTDNGLNPALPDAYSCLQLGWVVADFLPLQTPQDHSLTPWRSGGQPARVWTNGQAGTEFFLLETRDPLTTAPFDAGLPRGQMLLYHIDETVPEGFVGYDDSDQHHLRVRLIEADNDQYLRQGDDDGRDEDSFPGPLNITSLTPFSQPNSQGYTGPTLVHLENIQSHQDSVSLNISASLTSVLDLRFSVGDGSPHPLDVKVESRGLPISSLDCRLNIRGEVGAEFPDGTQTREFSLHQSGSIWIPDEPLLVVLSEPPGAGDSTDFHFQFTADSVEVSEDLRSWVWTADPSIFDFQNPDWVFWDQDIPPDETGTRWHLWNQEPFLTTNGSAVLACTGEEFSNSSSWPNVQYGRRARTALISPALGPEVKAVQLIHAVEVEYLHPGTVMDGGVVFWEGPDGKLIPASPVDGWDAVISAQSNNPLAGVQAFGDSLLTLDEANFPQWRCDVLPVPETVGPWSLRLEFSSNYLWRQRGWFIAEMLPLDTRPESAFPIFWDSGEATCPGGLFWIYPTPNVDFSDPTVEFFDAGLGRFVEVPHLESEVRPCEDGFFVPGDVLLKNLPLSGLHRQQVRLRCHWQGNVVVSENVVVFADGGAEPVVYLEQPFPNPSPGGVKFLVDIPAGQSARLRIFDLRGRQVHSQEYTSGRQQIFWSGSDKNGRKLASGSYYFKLEGSGFSSTRKVVLIR